MTETIYKRKAWLVERIDDGTVRSVGPGGIALYVDEAGVWIDHEVPSSEYEDATVLERVAMPTNWFVSALSANGYKIEPPPGEGYGGIPDWAPEAPVEKTRQELIQDAGDALAELECAGNGLMKDSK